MNWLYDFLDGPSIWPRKWRRAFLLTLPLSGPLFFASKGLVIAVALPAALLWLVFDGLRGWVKGMWA
jgi:hypothetical protein